jgi:HprK-related kinase B
VVAEAVSVAELAGALRSQYALPHVLGLSLGGVGFELASNSAELVERLQAYLRSYTTPSSKAPRFRLALIQAPEAPSFDTAFADWPRELDKTGRKEEFYDAADGRIIRKVRTGMQFLVGEADLVALGDALENDNQVINFINTQYIRELVHQGYLLCHAAGLVAPSGRGIALAGRAGAGKSTLSLHNMAHEPWSFCSNDRLLIKDAGQGVHMRGVAKAPRINPGTALNNPALAELLPEGRRLALVDMPLAELWALEEKYDADIDRFFGPGRVQLTASLDAFLVLNWRHGQGRAQFTRVNPAERSDLLKLIAKSPGPFHWPALEPVVGADGVRLPPYQTTLAAYAAALQRVPLYEATGGVDFDGARKLCKELILDRPARAGSPGARK